MAELEGLYVGMGIDTSQLNSDFFDAEKTISENINRINREMKLVQLRGQIELEGLDESAEGIEKLRIQEDALMAQMGLQQDKIILLSAAYENLRETRGANAETTQQVEQKLLREQLALQKLEQQMEDLSEQEKIALGINIEMLALIEPAIAAIDSAVAAGTAMPIPHAKAAATALIGVAAVAEGTREATEEMQENNPAKVLDEDFQQAAETIDESWQQAVDSTHNAVAEIEKSVDEVDKSLLDMKLFPELDGESFLKAIELLESDSLGESLRKANELINESDSIIGKLAAYAIGLGEIYSQIDEPIIEFAQKAIENFRELEQVANELNLSIPKASDLVSKINLSGADYNDVRDFVRGVQDAVIKGDSEDPEVLALERYGVVIQDTQGKLLEFDETLERLYQGYLKAREAGEAEAYIIMTNGQAVQDVLPYFESLAKAEEDMAKIKWSTIDIATLEEAKRDSKLLETQMAEFENALSSLAAPAADIALKNTFEIFKTGTELIEENREAIIYWSFVLMEGTNAIAELGKELGGEAKEALLDFGKELRDFAEEFQLLDKVKSLLPEEFLSSSDDDIFSRAQKRLEDYKKANEEARKATEKTKSELLDQVGISYSQNRIQNYKDELTNLELDIKFGDGFNYQKAIEQENLWREKALRNAKYYADEQEAIEELYQARIAKIKQEQDEKIAEMEKRIQDRLKSAADIEFGLTHAAFEKQLRDIERYKEAMQEKAESEKEAAAIAAESAAKAAEAFEREVDRIKGKLQSLDDKIFELDHSQYENDLRRIQQDYFKAAQEWIDAGLFTPEVKGKLDYLYSRQKQNLDKRADESRAKDGDYTKPPEGAMQRGGNGITVIGGDQIIDDGLKNLQLNIGVLADERNIRAQLSRNLSENAQKIVAEIDARRQLMDAQKTFAQKVQSGFELIEGDKVAVANDFQPLASSYDLIAGDKIAANMLNFDSALQQATTEIEQFAPTTVQSVADAQKTLSEAFSNFPAEYLKNLADGTEAVSTMQLSLTESTMKLIDAQDKLSDVLNNLPEINPAQGKDFAGGFQNLSLQRQTLQREPEKIPTNQDNGIKAGFDWDIFGGLLGLAALIPHPAAKALAIGGSVGIGAGIGTYNATYDSSEQIDKRLKPFGDIDLSAVIEPIKSVEDKFQSALQELQSFHSDMHVDIQEINFPTEVIVTPLEKISGIVEKILSSLTDREPPNITVSPNIHNELGGAYVFDEAMKKSLVDDITSTIANAVKDAVQQGVSKSNYGYSA